MNYYKRFHLISTIGIILLFFSFQLSASPVNKRANRKVKKAVKEFVADISQKSIYTFKCDSIGLDMNQKEIVLYMNSVLSYLPFRNENVASYYQNIKQELGRRFRNYSVRIESMGMEISELIPNYYREQHEQDHSRLDVETVFKDVLVRRANPTYSFDSGLQNKHIALWNSHGWYYENTLDRWEWQRARVFTTVEDIWSSEFILQYIVPMLENAGANVFLPRERSLQKEEVIVDSDWSSKRSEYKESGNWQQGEFGFANRYPFYTEGENPFKMGKSKQVLANRSKENMIEYIPYIPEKGEYAVSVCYEPNEKNVTDASYTVYHSGGSTEFKVNQQIGGRTWIYLGTFLFDKGKNPKSGKVLLSSKSETNGKFVSADAVRFGGGMGNIARGNDQQLAELKKLRNKKGFDLDSSVWMPYVSQRARYIEAARYYLQYAGMPDSIVYSINKDYKADYSNRGKEAAKFQKRENGKTDYKDDYMSRGEWVDYLIGAPNGPNKHVNAKGLGIPIDMALAFHTDAGITPDDSIIGTLAIYNTTRGEDHFVNGQSKWASRDLTDIVQTQVVEDIQKLFEPKWTRRAMWNKQYSEAYRPKVPTMLSEMMSHQNFSDMYQAMDPRFKFHISRAYYKGILKFLSHQSGNDFVVQPLPVDHLGMKEQNGNLLLSWKAVEDPLEETASAKAYKIYTRKEDGGFDNGKLVSSPEIQLSDLEAGVIYSFKVTALNEGGESFPSEILSYCKSKKGEKPILIVNGFDRVAAPYGFDNGTQAGFLNSEDEGVAYKQNIGFVGDQYDFERKSAWLDDDAPGFGASYADGEEKIIPGNCFDYPYVHGKAIRKAGFGFVSMSDEVFEEQNWNAEDYQAVDLIFGEEKTTKRMYGKENKDFTIYTASMQNAIRKYISNSNANLMISGAYIGTDLELCGDSLAINFAEKELHFKFRTNHASKLGDLVISKQAKNDFEGKYQFETNYNAEIYKVEAPDAIEPAGKNARVMMRYEKNAKSAAVLYDGDYRSVLFGFPFESLKTDKERAKLMKQIMKFFKSK